MKTSLLVSIAAAASLLGASIPFSAAQAQQRIYRQPTAPIQVVPVSPKAPINDIAAPNIVLEDTYCYGDSGKSGPTGSWPPCNQDFWAGCEQAGGVENSLPHLDGWEACING